MKEWFFAVGSEQQGPIEEDVLVNRLQTGQLPKDVLVWTPGMKDWMRADRVEGLIPVATVPPMEAGTMPPLPSAVESSPDPIFLHIPISRLIVMSILSCGLYEMYWIYKNWKYLKHRDHLNIMPFWRAWFGIFHCHSLLGAIHEDPELSRIETPAFSSSGLATGWVVLVILSNIVVRVPSELASIAAFLLPSFLFLVPVQKYINRINRKKRPHGSFSKWSMGHVVCFVVGIAVWGLTLLGLVVEEI
jgi:hypothetical protein